MVKRKFFFFFVLLSLVITNLPEVSSAQSKKIKLSKRNVILNKNESCKIKLKAAKKKKIKWYSTNKKIASVKNGLLKAKKKGQCIVIAKYKGKEYKCNVLVKKMKSIAKAPVSNAKLPAKTPSVSQSLPSEDSKRDYIFSEIKNFDGVLFQAKVDGDVLNLKIINHSGTDITLEKIFLLEYYNNSQWETVKINTGSYFQEILLIVENGGEYTEKINLNQYFTGLTSGKYRITKQVRANNQGKIQCEFTME